MFRLKLFHIHISLFNPLSSLFQFFQVLVGCKSALHDGYRIRSFLAAIESPLSRSPAWRQMPNRVQPVISRPVCLS
ncbi:hypothetical protein K1719_010416 [Acacia pycnantha]|nr:hypothetical protein K1719_010416 [Acacia pycnantha]